MNIAYPVSYTEPDDRVSRPGLNEIMNHMDDDEGFTRRLRAALVALLDSDLTPAEYYKRIEQIVEDAEEELISLRSSR